jgi:Rap1a immunity proteins
MTRCNRHRIYLLLLGVLASSGAYAEFWNGTELMQHLEEDMRGDSTYLVGTASGYIMGVADSVSGTQVCAPSGVTLKQTKQVVFNYMKSHPESWNQTADAIIVSALHATWPCAKN